MGDTAMTIPAPDLRELLAKATNVGDWRTGRLGIEPLPYVVDFGPPPKSPYMVLTKATPAAPGFTGISEGGVCYSDDGSSEANAALIVAAVNALPSLLDTIARLEAREKELVEALRQVRINANRAADAVCDGNLGFRGCEDRFRVIEKLAALTPETDHD